MLTVDEKPKVTLAVLAELLPKWTATADPTGQVALDFVTCAIFLPPDRARSLAEQLMQAAADAEAVNALKE